MVQNTIILNMISLVWPIYSAIKEKHFVKRSSAVFNGLSIILVGIGLLIEQNSLMFIGLPLAIFPLIFGVLIIALTSTKEDLGTILGSGKVTLIFLCLLLFIQYRII